MSGMYLHAIEVRVLCKASRQHELLDPSRDFLLP
jgi:hypothetical protein